MDIKTVMAKVQLCLNLAASGNVHEAAAASAKAQELMSKYNLSRWEVEQAGAPKDPYGERTEGLGKNEEWRRNLFFGIARENNCKAVHYAGSDRMGIVGKAHDIEFCIFLNHYLADAVAEMVETEYVMNRWKFPFTGDQAKVWKDSFRLGAVSELEARMKAQREALDNDPNSTAMVLSNSAALEAAFRRAHPHTGFSRPSRQVAISADGRKAGREAAARLNLSRPLGGGAAPRKPAGALGN